MKLCKLFFLLLVGFFFIFFMFIVGSDFLIINFGLEEG